MKHFLSAFKPCNSNSSSKRAKVEKNLRNKKTEANRQKFLNRENLLFTSTPFQEQNPKALNQYEKQDLRQNLQESKEIENFFNSHAKSTDLTLDNSQREREKPNSKVLCEICLEELTTESISILSVCKDGFHLDCLKTYIAEEIKIKSFPLKCPKCLKEMKEKEIELFLNTEPEQQANYKKFYQKFIIMTNPEKYLSCPDPKCEYAWYIDSLPIDNKMDCPKCLNPFCIKCKSLWHHGISCKQFQNQTKKMFQRKMKVYEKAFQKYSKERKLRKCPKCGQFVEKIYGCDAVKCAQCHSLFCYKCGKEGDGHLCDHDNSSCFLF